MLLNYSIWILDEIKLNLKKSRRELDKLLRHFSSLVNLCGDMYTQWAYDYFIDE